MDRHKSYGRDLLLSVVGGVIATVLVNNADDFDIAGTRIIERAQAAIDAVGVFLAASMLIWILFWSSLAFESFSLLAFLLKRGSGIEWFGVLVFVVQAAMAGAVLYLVVQIILDPSYVNSGG